MNTRKLAVVLVLLTVLAAMVVPAFAATEHSKTITEDDINATYRVSNPARRSVSDVYVDLQEGQAVITATMTLRGKDPVAVSVTFVPSISNGRLYWTVTAATEDGNPVSADLLAEINLRISAAWRNYIRDHAPAGHFTSITITETDLTITGVTAK